MGLLEKAYEFKKEMNRKGQVTLIDKIKGPAETKIENNDNQQMENLSKINPNTEDETFSNEDDLFQLPDDDNYSPLDALKEQMTQTDVNLESEISEEKKMPASEKKYKSLDVKTSDPLTREDDPILPKDIDKPDSESPNNTPEETDYQKNKSDENKEKIPEIEPEIIYDDNNSNSSETEIINTNMETFLNRENNKVMSAENITLYEIEKEIAGSESKKALFEVVLFSIMGQIGTSAAAIFIKNDENKWEIAKYSGLRAADKPLFFDASSGIMKNIKKEILDISKYADDPECKEQYDQLISLKTRLLVPWFYKGKVIGILALGDKITDEDYNPEEKELMQAICEASALELNKITTIEKLRNEIETAQKDLDFFQRANKLQENVLKKDSIAKLNDIIKKEFTAQGIISYSVFIKDSTREKFIPVINEISITQHTEDGKFSIDGNDPLVSLMKNDVLRKEELNDSEIINQTFPESFLNKTPLLWIYPVVIASQLAGFLAVFEVNEELANADTGKKTDEHLHRLSQLLISGILNIKQMEQENKFSDSISIIYNRIKRELGNSKRLNIPCSLIVFSIKNFKRYASVFGYEKSKDLFDTFSGLINSRLSDTDFSARYGRNKILILLPGNDKKFATTLANTVRNELMRQFKENEMQLLVTFLISEYPEDGEDLMTFTDNID